MAFRVFTVPILSSDSFTEELNAFLRSHRIIKIDRDLIEHGSSSYWVFCVEFLEGANPNDVPTRSNPARAKVDYREILSESDFAVYAKLRDIRKEIAQREAVPVYTIFTNDQLALMVTHRAKSRADLAKIEGVGDARLDKYSSKVLELLSATWNNGEASNEASGQPF